MTRFILVGFIFGLVLAACLGPAPQPCTECGGRCVDLQSDSANCGACGTACAAGSRCQEGTCRLSCPTPLVTCGTSCIDTRNDNRNCGACGNSCADGTFCTGGSCSSLCPTGSVACGPAGMQTCVSTANDGENCGACGSRCDAGTRCEAGQCTTTCAAPLSTCSTGCADLRSDNQNCGACGTTCQAGEFCSGGRCTSVCPTGTTRCTQGSTVSCAVVATDSENCGQCGVVCGTGQRCRSGQCTVECVAPSSLCGSSTDGGTCTLVSSDRANCGQCGRACGPTEDCLGGACTPRLISSCEEVPNVTDAGTTVLLFQNRSPVRPFEARCLSVGAQTRTYLLVDAGGNFSEYDNFQFGIGCQTISGPNPLTTFSGIRFDPSTGLVQVDDFTLSVSVDGGRFGTNAPPVGGARVAWASTGDCSCFAPRGDARIDLRGSPFGVDQASTAFALEGFNPRGGATITERGQLGVLSGGGYCGGLTPRLPDGRPGVRLRYTNTWSCDSILRARPGATSGVYNLFDGTGPNATGSPLAWCDMTTGGGGWTLLLKVDGRRSDSAFSYESPLWTSDSLFGPAVPDVAEVEAKYAAFSSLPFTELRLVNTATNASLTLTAPPNTASLRDLVSGGAPVNFPMPLGAIRWLQFFGGPADAGALQPNCNREAFGNVTTVARVRLGLLTNNEADCASPDSFAGVGGSLSAPNCFGQPDGGFQGPFVAAACGPGVAAPIFVQVWAR